MWISINRWRKKQYVFMSLIFCWCCFVPISLLINIIFFISEITMTVSLFLLFFHQSLPYTYSNSFNFMAFILINCCDMHIYTCAFLNINSLVYIKIFLFMFSRLTTWYWINNYHDSSLWKIISLTFRIP